MVKGIRVNVLAKELGVESKAILAKMRDEGVPNVPANHQATIPLGLAASVREWFTNAEGAGGTAVETAAPVDTAVKKATSRSRKKKAEETDAPAASDDSNSNTAVIEAPPEPVSSNPSAGESPAPRRQTRQGRNSSRAHPDTDANNRNCSRRRTANCASSSGDSARCATSCAPVAPSIAATTHAPCRTTQASPRPVCSAGSASHGDTRQPQSSSAGRKKARHARTAPW